MNFPSWVYVIKLSTTQKVYVGISSNPKNRFNQHCSALRRGAHPVGDFQKDYNHYGGVLTFRIVDQVNDWGERRKEFVWQQKLRSLERSCGYNYRDPVTRWLFPKQRKETK